MTLKTWGGKRQNAGRPATGAKPNRTFRLDDDEYQKVKNFIKNIRSDEKMLLKTDEDVRELMAKNVKLHEKIDWELDKQEDAGKEIDFMQAARDSKAGNPVLWMGIEIAE